MNRNVVIDVDAASWTTSTPPAAFTSGSAQFDIPGVLLLIGFLTAPPRAAGFTLSEFWAWIRYVSAISNDGDMKLVSDYRELDPHQKTILSDDFGMGFSMYWLIPRLGISRVCDGRYFIDRFLAVTGATLLGGGTKKRGPSKSPDFVCLSPDGKFHIIECKGTQSGPTTQIAQVQRGLPQKRTITFPAPQIGERIVSALDIAMEGDPAGSRLLIVDPEPKPLLKVDADKIDTAAASVARGFSARLFACSGFPNAASAFGDPDGGKLRMERDLLRKKSKRASGLQYEEWRMIDEERKRKAREELSSWRATKQEFKLNGGVYAGVERRIDIPVPVYIGGQVCTRVRIRQALNRDFLDIDTDQFSEVSSLENDSTSDLSDFDFVQTSDDRQSSLKIGSQFIGELQFLA